MKNTNDLESKFLNSNSGFIAYWKLFLMKMLNIFKIYLVSSNTKRKFNIYSPNICYEDEMKWYSREFVVNDNLLSTCCDSTEYRDQWRITDFDLKFIVESFGTQKMLCRVAAWALRAHTKTAKAECTVLQDF